MVRPLSALTSSACKVRAFFQADDSHYRRHREELPRRSAVVRVLEADPSDTKNDRRALAPDSFSVSDRLSELVTMDPERELRIRNIIIPALLSELLLWKH